MPCSYRILTDLNVVAIAFDGELEHRAVLRLLDDLQDDPGYLPTINELVCFENLRSGQLDPEMQRNLLNMIRGMALMNSASKKIALVAPQHPGRAFAWAYASVMRRNPKLDIAIFEKSEDAFRFLEPDKAASGRSALRVF